MPLCSGMAERTPPQAETGFALAGAFADADPAHWRALAEKALAGAPFETLIGHTPDAIPVRPVYTSADWPHAREPAPSPPAGWDSRQIVSRPTPREANGEILADLMGGATSIELRLDRGDRRGDGRGVALGSIEDFAAALEGVRLDLAPIALDAAGRAGASLLGAYAAKRGAEDAALAFNLDPIGAALDAVDPEMAETFAFAAELAARFANACLLRADARPVHEAAGSPAQELALLLAAGAAYLRAGERVGLSPETISARTLATVAVGPEIVLEIAKLRAARLVWSALLEACGAAPSARVLRLQAVTGRRMLTRRDVSVNLLRASASAFAGAVGGADIVTIAPFTDALGEASAFARRLARNTHFLLAEEARIGRVRDPAAGAWAIEALTDEIAGKAWDLFQDMERRGGALACISDGSLAAGIERVRAQRLDKIRTRSAPITGVSTFASLDEPSFAFDPRPPGAAGPALLPAIALAHPFEALRDAADAARFPPVFLAGLGPPAEFAAPALYAKGVFEAGGMGVCAPAPPAAFGASGARVACLCGTEATYAALGPAAASELRAAGCALVFAAGAPSAAAGVDAFLFDGADIVAALTRAHAAAGGA